MHDTQPNAPEATKPIDWTEKGRETVGKVFQELNESNYRLVESVNNYLYSHSGGSAGVLDTLDGSIRPTDSDNYLAARDEFFQDCLGYTNQFITAIEAQLAQISAIADPNNDSPDSMDNIYQNAQFALNELLAVQDQKDFASKAEQLSELVKKTIDKIRTDADTILNSTSQIRQLSSDEFSRFDWWADADSKPEDHQEWTDSHRRSLYQFNDLVQSASGVVQSSAEFVKSQVTEENLDPVTEFVKEFQQEFSM